MNTMTGIVLRSGSPTVRSNLQVPSPSEGEVLVRVTHATVNGHEIAVATSVFARLFGRLMGARGEVRTGLEFAGIMESEGEHLQLGDQVLGYVDMTRGWRPHAELIAIPESYLARRPAELAASDASALSMSGQTALVALRDIAAVGPGDSVLILGASGGVGVMAVQIARLLGARVTAVSKPRHHPLLKRLGAATVVDSEGLDLSALTGAHALVFDLTTTHRYRHIRHLLAPGGSFVPANPLNSLLDVLVRPSVRYLWVDKGDSAKLEELAGWAAAGRIEAVIDSVHTLVDVDAAFARAQARGKAGRVVLALPPPSAQAA